MVHVTSQLSGLGDYYVGGEYGADVIVDAMCDECDIK
jgi:hypothetical protein